MVIVIMNGPIFRSLKSQTVVQFSFKKETGRTPDTGLFRSLKSQTVVQFSFNKETGRTDGRRTDAGRTPDAGCEPRPIVALLNRRLLCSLA